MSTAKYSSLEEYLAFLENAETVRKALLGPPSNSGVLVGGSNTDAVPRSRNTYGIVRGRVEGSRCSIHGTEAIRVYTSGRRVCRKCETDYERARKAQKRGYSGRAPRPRKAHSHEGPCIWKTKPSGGLYCRPQTTLDTARWRERRRNGESRR